MQWHIVQTAENEWSVRRGDVYHYAQTAKGAVALWIALVDECNV